MKLMYICDGDPEKLPTIGTEISLTPELSFEVKGYGESHEITGPNKLISVYEIELLGEMHEGK